MNAPRVWHIYISEVTILFNMSDRLQFVFEKRSNSWLDLKGFTSEWLVAKYTEEYLQLQFSQKKAIASQITGTSTAYLTTSSDEHVASGFPSQRVYNVEGASMSSCHYYVMYNFSSLSQNARNGISMLYILKGHVNWIYFNTC